MMKVVWQGRPEKLQRENEVVEEKWEGGGTGALKARGPEEKIGVLPRVALGENSPMEFF